MGNQADHGHDLDGPRDAHGDIKGRMCVGWFFLVSLVGVRLSLTMGTQGGVWS